MRKVLVTTLLVAATVGSQAQVKNQSHGYPIDPVPFTSVKVTDSFWGQRLNASREVTIPLAFSKCEETGRYQNFVNAAHPSDTIKVGGLAFDDTDVYKTIEGASYLFYTKDEQKRVDTLLRLTRNTDDCRSVHFDFNHEKLVVEEKQNVDKFNIKCYF